MRLKCWLLGCRDRKFHCTRCGKAIWDRGHCDFNVYWRVRLRLRLACRLLGCRLAGDPITCDRCCACGRDDPPTIMLGPWWWLVSRMWRVRFWLRDHFGPRRCKHCSRWLPSWVSTYGGGDFCNVDCFQRWMPF